MQQIEQLQLENRQLKDEVALAESRLEESKQIITTLNSDNTQLHTQLDEIQARPQAERLKARQQLEKLHSLADQLQCVRSEISRIK